MNKKINNVKAPPLKIQGIKTKLVSFIMHNVKWDGQGRWVEPFLGSGVVVLNVNPEKALLADTNEHIIHFYRQVAWALERIKGKDWHFMIRDWRDTLSQIEDSDFVYLDPPYNDRHTDYYNQWRDSDADGLAQAVKKLKAPFAYSTWKQNKYRTNDHLTKHFSDFPTATKAHFYHIGSKESLRNAMEEALVMSPDCVAKNEKDSMLPDFQEQFAISF